MGVSSICKLKIAYC